MFELRIAAELLAEGRVLWHSTVIVKLNRISSVVVKVSDGVAATVMNSTTVTVERFRKGSPEKCMIS